MTWTTLLDLTAAGMVGAALGHLAGVAYVLDRRRMARHADAAVRALVADVRAAADRARREADREDVSCMTRPPRTDAADRVLVADPDHPPIRGGCLDCLATRSATTDPDGTVHVRTRHDPTCPAITIRKD